MTYVGSKKSRKQLAHRNDCHHAARIRAPYLVSFADAKEAMNAGRHFCWHCAPLAAAFQADRSGLEAYADAHGLQLYLGDEVLHIISAYDCWRILLDPAGSGKLHLYHRNRRTSSADRDALVPGYHRQRVFETSIACYLVDIVSHDRYRGRQAQCAAAPETIPTAELPAWLAKKRGISPKAPPKQQQRPGKAGAEARQRKRKRYEAEQKRRHKNAQTRRVLDLLAELEAAHA